MATNGPADVGWSAIVGDFRQRPSNFDYGHDYLAGPEHRLASAILQQDPPTDITARVIAHRRHEEDRQSRPGRAG